MATPLWATAFSSGTMAIDPAEGLALSVVVPVRDGAEFLPRCLTALRASDLPPDSWELIVVDDGSRDGSADIAAGYADRVVRLPASEGSPPVARNRGTEVARASVIVFVDADVCVHGDALRRIRDLLHEEEGVSAVFGAFIGFFDFVWSRVLEFITLGTL